MRFSKRIMRLVWSLNAVFLLFLLSIGVYFCVTRIAAKFVDDKSAPIQSVKIVSKKEKVTDKSKLPSYQIGDNIIILKDYCIFEINSDAIDRDSIYKSNYSVSGLNGNAEPKFNVNLIFVSLIDKKL